MKKILLFTIVLIGQITLNGCSNLNISEVVDDRPVIHFDAASIMDHARNHQVKMLMLSSLPIDSVSVHNAIESLQNMKVNNNLYLNELKVLQHDDSSSEEYKSLIIDYLIEENSYIDKRIKGLHSGENHH